jgi:hypothetical protein
MDRTLPTFSDILQNEVEAIKMVRGLLMKDDQLALDEVLVYLDHHLAAGASAVHLHPFEAILLVMLLEEHKEVKRLKHLVEKLETSLIMEISNSPPRFVPP